MTSDPIARYLTQRTAKMDRRNRLRAMSGGEIIDVAIRVYQVLGWTFLKMTVVPTLFCVAAVTFFFRYVVPSYFVTNSPGSESAQLGEMATTTALGLFIAGPLFILGLSYISVIVAQLVSDFMIGASPSQEAAEAKGRQLLPRLFALNLREIFLAGAGFVVFVALLALAGHLGNVTAETDATAGVLLIIAWFGFVAGLIVFLIVIQKHALAPAVLVLEDVRVAAAAKRSANLLKNFGRHGSGAGSVWMLYGLLFLLYLLIDVGITSSLAFIGYPEQINGWITGFPFAGLIVEALGLLPSFLVLWTLIPVWAATTTIIYYDRRIRLEGYDIEALAQDVWRADRSRRFDL